ncbi:MAG: hypothetical protein IPH45_21315 [Bacteroidales bacterium]|nr:hypothetical protein [Bacteroidales bacterium]
MTNPPTIQAGPDQNVCSNVLSIQMADYFYSNASGADWSGGSGTWNGDVYTPSFS